MMKTIKHSLIFLGFIAAFLVASPAFGEPGDGGGRPPGDDGGKEGEFNDQKKDEMGQEMQECEKGMQEHFKNMGGFFNNRYHWAWQQFKEKKLMTKMIPSMIEAQMCRMNKELKRAGWKGEVPYTLEKTFPKGKSGGTMTVKMEIDKPTASGWGEGWADYDMGAIVTINGTQIMKIAWVGSASSNDGEKTKGMFVANNMHQAFSGNSGEKHSIVAKWNRIGDETDDTDLGDSLALDILEKFSVQSGESGFAMSAGQSGQKSRVVDLSFRRNGTTGGFTLKAQTLEARPDGQGADLMSFSMVAVSDNGKTGTIAVTKDSTGADPSGRTVKGLDSHTKVFDVNFETETVTDVDKVYTNFANNRRYEQRYAPNDLKAVRDENKDQGAGQHFGGSDGNAKFENFNPKDTFKRQ